MQSAMNMLGALSTGGMEMADMAWNIKCREEDMEFRRKEIQWHMEQVWWRAVDDRKRAVDEKAKQLEQIASLSALIAGFALVAIVEISIPEGVNPVLLVCFGLTTAAVVGLMLIAMLNSTFMLVAILKYDVKAKEKDPTYPSFEKFWANRCESDWRFAFRAFNLGIPLFLGVLAQVGWITFDGTENYNVASSCVSAVAVVSALVFYAYTYRKWGSFLSNMKLDLHQLRVDNPLDPWAADYNGLPYLAPHQQQEQRQQQQQQQPPPPPLQRGGGGSIRPYAGPRGGRAAPAGDQLGNGAPHDEEYGQALHDSIRVNA